MPKIQWKSYKNYSGPMIKGEIEIPVPSGNRANFHIERAFWLTSKVESGALCGSVMAYDGTGMTCGLDQHVAVYPRELSKPDDGNALDDQGTLWKLLRRLEMIPEKIGSLEVLWRHFESRGWYLAQDGVLRWYHNGKPVDGKTIRNNFTPIDGKARTRDHRDQAKQWATLFHNLFSNPYTFQVQIEYGKEHLTKRTARRRIKRSDGSLLKVTDFYPSDVTHCKLSEVWNLAEDLAMCMYQSHSVNAPSIANKALSKSCSTQNSERGLPSDKRIKWPKKLIYLLGTSKYGRWDDDIKYGRYQRTRTAARASGLWPLELFDGKNAIMPKNLKD